MGEVLRAILDDNSVDSRVAFYSVDFHTVTAGGGIAFAQRQVSMQCKTDTYFLLMGYAQDSCSVQTGVGAGWAGKSTPTTFTIQRASTGETFALTPTQQSLQNYNLNNFVTLDEYILFLPGELITVIENVGVNTAAAGIKLDTFLTMQGVEYQVANGKGI